MRTATAVVRAITASTLNAGGSSGELVREHGQSDLDIRAGACFMTSWRLSGHKPTEIRGYPRAPRHSRRTAILAICRDFLPRNARPSLEGPKPSDIRKDPPVTEGLGAVLDFGCGCGRIARNWVRLRGPELHGCDYNPEPVAWCRENLPFLEARVNSLEPPSPYSDDRFDLVYAISVLTHLPEALAHRWMADFARILRTGGQLLVTTHGDALREALGTRDRARYDAGEIVVRRPHMAGEDSCVAHHPRSYVTDRLLGGFDPVSFSGGDETPGFAHDVYLARLRAR